MSKWISEELFADFQVKKISEAENAQKDGNGGRFAYMWPTPGRGTADKPKVYEGRFLMDQDNKFYEEIYYHMIRSNEKWYFILCPKTHNFENYCPLCSVTSKLYLGSDSDKKMAYTFKRKNKYIGNFFIVKDPRDADKDSEDFKCSGKVKIFEFPAKVESKLKNEITDKRNGIGYSLFDPTDEGYNFILKVKATRPDSNGTIYSDYSDSIFARKSCSIGTDDEIEKIMEQRTKLSDYMKKLVCSDATIEAILKREMLIDLISDEWNKVKGITAKPSEKSTEKVEEKAKKTEKTEEKAEKAEKVEEKEEVISETDEDLLRELESM